MTYVLSEVFSNSEQQIAVIFIDDNNQSHLTPICEYIKGNTEIVTDYKDRAGWVCKCIKIDLPTIYSAGINTDPPNTNKSTQSATTNKDKPEWPSDLPPKSLLEQDIDKWLLATERKLEPSDIVAIPKLKVIARKWAMDKANQTNSFIISIANASARYAITPGQAKGILNYWRASLNLNRDSDIPSPDTTPIGDEGLDLSALHEGSYGVPGTDSRLKIRINKPTRGKWSGYVFVQDCATYGSQRRYGIQKPNALYTGDIQNELQLILDNPSLALKKYAQLTGNCGICRRPLEDAESLERGIGPICASRLDGL